MQILGKGEKFSECIFPDYTKQTFLPSKMREYASPIAVSPVDSKKRLDYFQRKKVGSIRDNPKLLKIRQQFENTCNDSVKCQSNLTEAESAPSSFSLSRHTSTVVLDQLLKINTKFSDKTEAYLKSHLETSPNRRNSEGDIKIQKSFSTVFYENSPKVNLSPKRPSDLKLVSPLSKFCGSSSYLSPETKSSITSPLTDPKRETRRFDSRTSPITSPSNEPKRETRRFDSQSPSSESGVHTNSSASEEDNVSSNPTKLRSPEVNYDANKFFRNVREEPPPIPRRGISPAVQNSFIHSHFNTDKKTHSVGNHSSTDDKTANTVQKAIQMYEGMASSDPKKHKTVKTTLKRDDSTSRRSFLIRRNSRRNSFRKSRLLGDKSDHQIALSPSKRKGIPSKDDSGVALSDGEDRSQSIYQTLSTTVNVSQSMDDPYDRLNRLHDVVSRIHKGQPSNCAACKAIPASVLQYRTTESSFTQVKCNEVAPHHHPPCICFSCQHSIFSCSENSESPPSDKIDEESLYYNVCCLNPPNREGWRQSRRRPVCEQNGRLCIVNCDMEKCPSLCMDSKSSEEFYDKLSECHSVSTTFQRDTTKFTPGDSCDSDEGWVDITDSEDERSFITNGRSLGMNSSTIRNDLPTHPSESIMQNSAYDMDHLVARCMNLDLSRAMSTEHLYESIADIDSQSEDAISKEHISHSSQDSVNSPMKGGHVAENDLDSGEWSTESPSPTFDESSNKGNEQKLTPLNQYRFMVNYECQEAAKQTFMKSVLGKKAVSPKKRRMSNFFVPWLVSNEYGSTSKNPKPASKKQNSRGQGTSTKTVPVKNKRSQSVPTNSPKLSISCTKDTRSSSDLLENCSPRERDEDNAFLSPDNPPSIGSRGSVASSAYLRSDQLQTTEIVKMKPNVPKEASVDVAVERVYKRSTSGNTEHDYILFQPVKEEDVPLYQFYERNIKERVSFCRSPKSLSPIMWSAASENCSYNDSCSKPIMPQLSVVEQLSPDAQDMKMLWCELPEVKDSGILERISAQDLKLQEAIFEFIQSQASYIRSLKVLFESFIRTPEFSDFESSSCVLSKHEYDVLFCDIIRVKEVSERLLGEITKRWNDGILMPDICDIIHQHAVLPSFSVYVKYCSNRVYQERTLKELKETRLCFLEVLRKHESNPVCQGLSLESFLFLPMQHISRLPLLLDNIFRWLVPESPSYGICKLALEAVHKIFVECNEGARKMERLEEMFVLNKQLEFKECKVIPLISASRWLLKKGELMKLEFDKKTFGRSSRCVRVPIYIFLFNDLLVVTKRKNDDCYTVVDYCLREKVQAMPVNAKDLHQPVVVPNTCRYLIYLTLFNNHQGSAVDMILNCSLLSERTRWIEAITSAPQNKPCEVWEYDCPQVQCVRSYIAQQPDELSLQESDVITIHRKMNDGWYEGRRLRDGLQGWFPASYTMDIPCSRARASNLRQCYRLLMLSQTQ